MAARTGASAELDASMPVVIFHGKDPFQLRERARRFADLLRERHGGLEEFAFDGAKCALVDVLDELRSYGLMQQHKLVVVDDADQLLAASGDDAGGKSSRRAMMERYAASPVEHATLVLRATTWRPGNLDKIVKKSGAIVKCDPPTAQQAVAWAVERCSRRHGATIERDAAALLVDRVGPELMRLDQELAKMAAFAGPGEAITRRHVGELVGLSREEQAWEIQSAILTGDAGTALSRLRELLDVSRLSEVLVFWAVCDLVRKLHAAARLAAAGEGPGGVARRLKLWGESRDVITRVAARVDPERIAQLLRTAIDSDVRTKTGAADPVRSLEALTVLVADSIGGS